MTLTLIETLIEGLIKSIEEFLVIQKDFEDGNTADPIVVLVNDLKASLQGWKAQIAVAKK